MGQCSSGGITHTILGDPLLTLSSVVRTLSWRELESKKCLRLENMALKLVSMHRLPRPCTGTHIHAQALTSMQMLSHTCTCSHIHAQTLTSMHKFSHPCTSSHIHAQALTSMHRLSRPCTCYQLCENLPRWIAVKGCRGDSVSLHLLHHLRAWLYGGRIFYLKKTSAA